MERRAALLTTAPQKQEQQWSFMQDNGDSFKEI